MLIKGCFKTIRIVVVQRQATLLVILLSSVMIQVGVIPQRGGTYVVAPAHVCPLGSGTCLNTTLSMASELRSESGHGDPSFGPALGLPSGPSLLLHLESSAQPSLICNRRNRPRPVKSHPFLLLHGRLENMRTTTLNPRATSRPMPLCSWGDGAKSKSFRGTRGPRQVIGAGDCCLYFHPLYLAPPSFAHANA
jgi:hypothetical protein